MESITNKEEKARFDTRLPKSQKELFEYAASLGGFRTLTDFVIHTLQEKSKEIIETHEQTLASKRDRELFFHALMNPSSPNDALTEAARNYKDTIAKQ